MELKILAVWLSYQECKNLNHLTLYHGNVFMSVLHQVSLLHIIYINSILCL